MTRTNAAQAHAKRRLMFFGDFERRINGIPGFAGRPGARAGRLGRLRIGAGASGPKSTPFVRIAAAPVGSENDALTSMHQGIILPGMRTTVTLDSDVYQAAMHVSRMTGKRLGKVLSELAVSDAKAFGKLVELAKV